MTGTVGVLNVGAGDTKLSFDPNNPAERIRAARIVRDMLRRGYALLVEVERDGVKRFERAVDFDESACEYVIADGPCADEAVRHEAAAATERSAEPKRQAGRKMGKQSVPAESTRAVAVARISGG